MDIFDLLMKLVQRFGLVDKTAFAEMYGDMDAWRSKLSTKTETNNPLIKFYVSHGREWYVRLAGALAYVPLVRVFYRWMNPELDGQEDQ